MREQAVAQADVVDVLAPRKSRGDDGARVLVRRTSGSKIQRHLTVPHASSRPAPPPFFTPETAPGRRPSGR